MPPIEAATGRGGPWEHKSSKRDSLKSQNCLGVFAHLLSVYRVVDPVEGFSEE